MRTKLINNKNYDYWKNPEKPYPKNIYWEVIAPKGERLNVLMDHDVVFDDYDMKIRQLPI